MNISLLERVRQYLREHRTMNIATADVEGNPHAAAVFYAEDEQMNLYYVSDSDARHSMNIFHRPQIAATIQNDGQHWLKIQGLQLRGICAEVPLADRDYALSVYSAKYPFVATQTILLQHLRSIAFYRLIPHWLRLIDNNLGFGHEEEIIMNDLQNQTH